jgi:hypothetical protein
MESIIEEFVSVRHEFGDGDGDGFGNGSGYCDCTGNGGGNSDSAGALVGTGPGNGSGSCGYYGSGTGSGIPTAAAHYSGTGDGNTIGTGTGTGIGTGIKSINNSNVYLIDDVQTIITKVKGNYAKGFILMDDLTLRKCFVVKHGNIFAHGDSLQEAHRALEDKLYEDMSVEDRIDAFIEAHSYDKEYLVSDYYEWHGKLTLSCESGRKAYLENNGLQMNDTMSVAKFIELTKNEYGGGIIKQLEEVYSVA